ncbi:MAG: MmgE/PrpD family protein [Betaproteobacteria bacterium]
MGAARTLTESLADYWSAARYEDLPAETVRLAKRFLVDTLAAGIAGANTDVVDAALAAAQASVEATSGSATVWGRAETLPAPMAAMVNGTAAHALELDDFGGCGHSGAVVTPALCALAGRLTFSGKEAITALVAGYDLAARTLEGAGGYRPVNDLGWHSTGICGSFGAAAASAKLLGLDAERFADALGVAGTFTGGIWAFLADGAMTKRFHPGKASENGLSAALLAQSGMTGPRKVLEAEWGGFYSTYAKGVATPEATLAGLGSEFRIARSGMKPYACCRGLHACQDTLFDTMRELRLASTDIAGMVVHGNEQYRLQFDRPTVGSLLEAQFSIQYALAAGAVSGRGTLDQFAPLRDAEPEVKRLMGATRVLADRVVKPGQYPPLEFELADGRRIERHTPFAKGAPERPLTDEELRAKVDSLLEPALGVAGCRALIECVADLESVKDFRELVRLLVPAERHRRAA